MAACAGAAACATVCALTYSEVDQVVLAIVITMLVILLLAGAVAVYVAFPHRGADIPGAPWLGDAMAKAADVLPLIEDDDDGEVTPHHSMLR